MLKLRMRTKFLLSMLLISAGLTCTSLLLVRHSVQKQIRLEIFADLRNSVSTFQNFQHEREITLTHSAELLADLPAYPGVWIEAKRNTYSVHLLGASPETRRRMRQRVSKRVRPMRQTLRVMENLRDVEVAPVVIGDKGVAVRKFLDAPPMRGALPVYFGDDFSDEPGFVAARKGIPILVGKRRETQAKFCLRGPAEVTEALSKMEEILR